ncbi:YdaS family helix-turn-helix protein [Pseudacidovorax sp. RU35E]|uniref:transcriptional regulator n=1 Tax=Pseudacidovorax sp. RU35E TaxID=1907403 RepID=UPI000970FE32|nr:YdaS family helix-turn-helix protein [Pseudacidovorax sp. RU35E]
MDAIARAIEAGGGPAEVARRLGVTTQAVCFWRDGSRKLPVRYGAAIESACHGLVTRRDLWPDDWKAIWPELVELGSASVAFEEGRQRDAMGLHV